VQRIKNPNTATSRAMRNLSAKRRWGLSGTPLENQQEDLASIFAFISPGLFRLSEAGLLSAGAVRQRVKPLMLRRRKQEALPELPQKVVATKWLELSLSQRQAYDRAESQGVGRLRADRGVTVQHVLALIQRLKQICNFDPDTGDSGKMEYILEEYLPEACSDGQKALIVSQYVRSLEEVQARLQEYRPLLFTGQLSTGQRNTILEEFERREEHRVLLLSLRAGGVGLNLVRANSVLHFDRWWNPAVERQAEDRTHRIGQSRTVFVTRLICQETIEERIEQLLERKNILFEQVVDELADVNLERVLSEEELFGLFHLTPPRRRGREETDPTSRRELPEIPPADRKTMVVTADEPFSTLMRLRQILRDSEEFIWWADPHFRVEALEELIVCLDPARVRDLKILSGPQNINDRAKQDFGRFREEVQRKGAIAEWRIHPRFGHDRFLISRNYCYNIPPVGIFFKPTYAEILETPNRPPFEDWWARAVPLEGPAT
jgi:hypothetical protein